MSFSCALWVAFDEPWKLNMLFRVGIRNCKERHGLHRCILFATIFTVSLLILFDWGGEVMGWGGGVSCFRVNLHWNCQTGNETPFRRPNEEKRNQHSTNISNYALRQTVCTYHIYLVEMVVLAPFSYVRTPNNTIKINYQPTRASLTSILASFLFFFSVSLLSWQLFRCLLCWLFISFAFWLSTTVAFFKLNSTTTTHIEKDHFHSLFPLSISVALPWHFNRHVIIGKVCIMPNKWLYCNKNSLFNIIWLVIPCLWASSIGLRLCNYRFKLNQFYQQWFCCSIDGFSWFYWIKLFTVPHCEVFQVWIFTELFMFFIQEVLRILAMKSIKT